MKIKMSRGEKIFQVVNYFVLSIIVLVCLYPMWHVAMASFSNSTQLMAHSGFLLKPMGFNMQAYLKVFQNPMILKGYANTLFILIVGVILDLIMTALAAYFFSRKGVMFKKPLMLLILFTMFFSGGMIPFYLTLKDMHMINSRWGLIVPFMISTYNMIILRTSFESIPDSLTEAAKIDGCSTFGIYRKIILPLSQNGLATLTVLTFNSVWNDYMGPMIYLDSDRLKTIQLGLASFQQQFSADYGAIMAGTVCSVIPIIIVYCIGQKYIVEGVAFAGVKG